MNSGILKITLTRSLIKKTCLPRGASTNSNGTDEMKGQTCPGEKMSKLAEKLRQKTPIGKLDELEEGQHPYQEKEPLKPFPDGVNPVTGEKGGPRGPEPTRYGDWERKGRVTDF